VVKFILRGNCQGRIVGTDHDIGDHPLGAVVVGVKISGGLENEGSRDDKDSARVGVVGQSTDYFTEIIWMSMNR